MATTPQVLWSFTKIFSSIKKKGGIDWWKYFKTIIGSIGTWVVNFVFFKIFLNPHSLIQSKFNLKLVDGFKYMEVLIGIYKKCYIDFSISKYSGLDKYTILNIMTKINPCDQNHLKMVSMNMSTLCANLYKILLLLNWI